MDNKENILDKALMLFWERGYEAVGVQEIVEASGITKPTLYHYFGSKQGLLESLLEKYFSILMERVKKATEYSGDVTYSLEKLAGTLFDFAKEYPEFTVMYMGLVYAPKDSVPSRAVMRLMEQEYRAVEEMFYQASLQHGNMKDRQREYAATFLGMVNSYAMMSLTGYIELSGQLVYRAVHQFMYGIFS